MKKYEVTINQNWSEQVKVKAKNKAEAQKLAWEKWRANKKNYTFFVHEQ